MSPPPSLRGWQLVWSDEFNGNALDLTKWGHEINCYGGGNSEAQCYTERHENSFVAQGKLHIVAQQEQYSGPAHKDDHLDYRIDDRSVTKAFTSARLRTVGKGEWRYGRFEVRAKLPMGQGTWGAVWMLPSDWVYGEWSSSGEIDIVEAVNLGAKLAPNAADNSEVETRVHGTLHYGQEWPNNVYSGHAYRLPDNANPAVDFHVYAVEWEQDEIRWYVDDVHYATQTSQGWYSELVKGSESHIAAMDAPFNQRFHLLINFAVGGDWAEKVNENGIDLTVFPQVFEVDYVRVYQCVKSIETGKGCADRQVGATMVEGKRHLLLSPD
ncbi:glycoside hydrolase family 16 protein [Shewanella youngdeokensis]|uniref:Glycoside hydrolase family 16 protein n=1 Tax=Shewanella youngdeokensis TaxID=2999068 RepID=A0ABZ0K3I2_9GAMM|nr:glycoside hydrolase family 16 protein [Shewanella sp. DAU334]